jgi:hypothetical protein
MSLYESKRCWLVLPDVLKEKALQTHKEKMTAQHTTSTHAFEFLDAAVDIVIPPGSKFLKGLVVPTFSACKEAGRADGGAHSRFTVNDGEPCSYLYDLYNWSHATEQVSLAYNLHFNEEHEAHVQILPEPGKFRIITKGNASIYTGLRGLQKVFLDYWKKMPFSTMVDNSEERIRRRMRNGSGDFISGDYDAATDSMHMDVTVHVLKRMMDNLGINQDSDLYKVAVKSMSGGKIVYPDKSFVYQTNGQLMGHPLSFPILCIINLSTYMRTKDILDGKKILNHPFLINGDDILFREGGRDHIISDYDLWRLYAGEVGLIVNELKTYVHPHFNMINSIRHFDDKEIFYQNIALGS